MSFIHLRTHSEFSIIDGILRIDDAVDAARADSQPALALTDFSNLFGAIKFYQACRSRGIKPIIGADVWLEPLSANDKQPSRLLLLAQNELGYHHLCQLLAHAWTANIHRQQAWVKWEWLENWGDGLIALSGAENGAIGMAISAGDQARAKQIAQRLTGLFSGRFYIEVQRAGLAHQEAYIQAVVPLAVDLALPVVATHPVQFAQPEDFEAHEARVCIAEGETLSNPKRTKRFTAEQYLKTQAEMASLFADLPEALSNTERIAQRCNLSLVLGKPQLPNFPTPMLADGTPMPMGDFFRQSSLQGLERRLAHIYPNESKREQERPRYVERLEFEIATILKMGFPGYFLIVADFIEWAKNNGCPVGPGRGSGAGSLVAYALGITDLDPLRYQLLFERFLNPDRVSMPDFDVDFCQGNRDRVIEYVKLKYGREAVSQIATFGTMAAKAALRDVGRVLGMSYGHVDSIAKLIPAPPGKSVTLAQVPENPDSGVIYARKEAPELEQREAAEEEVAELLSLAMRVEGIVRNVGMHAGGVLIAPGKITDFCPLYQQLGSDSAVSQFDKDDVEAIGLVKFDFLGLATLTILELAKSFINARRPTLAPLAYENLPLDDQRVYKLFSEGRTEAVFQFESRGMQAMLREAKPTRIEDLIALNAMFRPGPMENIPSFCARKHGREEIVYPHPLLEQVLAETYGIFVYQEQVMQAAQVMGGYTLGGADLLRRAMGKKKPEEMAKERIKFRAGALEKGIAEAKADEVFDLMEKFAGYGFNKSHAAAYSLLAYHTAWIKVHCTAEFFAANMTIESDDTDKLNVLLADARDNFGLEFRAPDINSGTWRFEPISDRCIRYGLGAIKGTGRNAIEAIVAARDTPFKSLFDFAHRVDRQKVNKRAVEALIKAGAFDALHPNRAQTLAALPLAVEWADNQLANANQLGLFDLFEDESAHGSSAQEPPMPDMLAWRPRERLMHEKAALGFYLSGHLFDEVETEVRQFASRRIGDLVDSKDPVLVAGVINDLRIINGHRGRVALFKLDDKSQYIEAVLDEKLLLANKDLLQDDAVVIVQGKVQPDRFSGGLRLNIQQLWDMAAARARFGRFLSVTFQGHLPPLAEILARWPVCQVETPEGNTSLGLRIRYHCLNQSAKADIDLGPNVRFWPSDDALRHWAGLAHQGLAKVVYT